MLNLLWFAHLCATAEVLSIGVAAGVDLGTLRASLLASPAASHFVEADVLSVLRDGDYDEGFALALACKDLGLAVDLARATGVPAELSALVEQIYRRARAQYGDAGGEMLPIKLIEDLTGRPLRLPAAASGPRRRRGTRPGPRGRAGVTMAAELSGLQLAIAPTPTAHFGAGGIHKLGPLLGATGCSAAVIVTDAGLLATPVIGAVRAALDEAGIPAVVFSGVHSNPTTDDLAAERRDRRRAGLASRATLVAVGGGSSIDAAKGIALAAVNGERGRDLDYRNEFAQPGLPIVAVPTTAGTGAETNAFGVVTDPVTRRKFYVGHASTMPAAAILDPELTVGLPPAATAATGVDALTHAIESYLSVRANPWSDGIALQVIAMAGAHLARSVADGVTWRPGPRCCSPRTWPGSGWGPPGSAWCTPSGTRSAAGTTSPTA